MEIRLCCALLYWLCLITPVVSQAQPFTHPGILNNKTELDAIKAHVKRGEQPWKSAFESLQHDNHASLSYVAEPFADVQCGSYNKPNVGCNQQVDDAMAVYCHALLWYLTNDKRHADKAIETLHAWSSTYQKNTNSNARLVVSWATPWFVNGAELLRHTNAGWKKSDQALFNEMLAKFLPYVLDDSMPGNNWIQSAIEAHMAIAVFNDDRPLFNKAVDRWNQRVKTYLYQRSDGPKPVNTPGKSDEQMTSIWRMKAKSTDYIDGMGMETCRDLGHLNLGFSSMMYAAETAWHQQVDLFAGEKKRLSDFMELHGSWMTGAVAVPPTICDGTVRARLADTTGVQPPTGGGRAVWEIAYNHLHDRLGVPLPYTRQMLEQGRPASISRWVAKGETLTHAQRIFLSEQNSGKK